MPQRAPRAAAPPVYPLVLRYVTEKNPMPRGRKPEGEHPLSNAERQARHRARHQAHQTTSVIRFRRPADRRSRLQRWHDAVAMLVALQTEYAAWYDALPNSLRDTPQPRPWRPSPRLIR